MNQTSTISNEQNQLVNMLQLMYDDNIRQINGMTTSINSIRNNNTQIRNILVQILNHSTTRNDTQRQRQRQRQTNRPYIIDSVGYYSLPSTTNRNFLEPVDVYPTQTQIEIATRNVQYCDIVNPISRCCPISLDTFNDTDMVAVIRFCGHIFKPEQLQSWFRTNCRCPVCRYDIRNYNLNTSSLNNFTTDPSNNSSSNNSSSNNSSSNIFTTRENESTEERRIPNTIANYLDLIFDNNSPVRNNLNDNLLNIIDNNSDANAILTLFNSALRRM